MSLPDSDRPSSNDSRRILSALADGDATHSEAARAFQAWRDDPDARATWHAWQLIGDVLRSDDLAAEPAADEAFLVALRARLATEPVVLAPQPRADEASVAQPVAANASARSRARWQGPVAMAAGFLAVVGVLNVAGPFRHGGNPSLAAAGASAPGPLLASTTSVNNSGAVPTSVQTPAQTQAAADQLAPYLAAHRQSAMSGPFQMPGSDLRNVSLVQPAQ